VAAALQKNRLERAQWSTVGQSRNAWIWSGPGARIANWLKKVNFKLYLFKTTTTITTMTKGT